MRQEKSYLSMQSHRKKFIEHKGQQLWRSVDFCKTKFYFQRLQSWTK
jgi:hypothetical protein